MNVSVLFTLCRLCQHGGETFVYLFDHHSSINPWPEWMGIIHGYETEFILGMPQNRSLGLGKWKTGS